MPLPLEVLLPQEGSLVPQAVLRLEGFLQAGCNLQSQPSISECCQSEQEPASSIVHPAPAPQERTFQAEHCPMGCPPRAFLYQMDSAEI